MTPSIYTEADDLSGLATLPFASAARITGNENVLILAPHPGDESLFCGGLMAELCRIGRPPFVMVLDDGSATHPHSRSHPPEVLARLREQETRAAVAHLGLPPARLLLVGLMDSAIPTHGPVFEAVVRAMALVMWARDCNLVCAPSPNTADPGHLAAHHMARAVVAETGVAYLGYAPLPSTHEATSGMGWRLDISPHLPAKAAAIATHASQQGKIVQDDPTGRHWTPTLLSASRQPYEVYLPD